MKFNLRLNTPAFSRERLLVRRKDVRNRLRRHEIVAERSNVLKGDRRLDAFTHDDLVKNDAIQIRGNRCGLRGGRDNLKFDGLVGLAL